MAEDPSSQTEAPSERKLGEAREKGDVAKSQDVGAFFALAGTTLALVWGGEWMTKGLVGSLRLYLDRPDKIDLTVDGTRLLLTAVGQAILPGLAVIFGATLVAGVAGNLIQTGFMFTPAKLFEGGLGRLSPIQGFKRLFGVDALIQFIKSTLKILILSVVAWMVLKPHAQAITQLAALDVTAIIPLTWDILKLLMIAALITLGVGAGIDWIIQYMRFMQRMKMSKQEVKDEYKQSEGDPQMKARLRQIRNQRARRRMIQAVPTATVVVMNPTHYAVALRYEAGETSVPICVAKGLDRVALKIRSVAEEANVPVIEDPPLARALYATVEIDEEIPREQYEAVAKVIGFILGSRRTGRRTG
jgi:flagellar biosynthetic protein FlhB